MAQGVIAAARSKVSWGVTVVSHRHEPVVSSKTCTQQQGNWLSIRQESSQVKGSDACWTTYAILQHTRILSSLKVWGMLSVIFAAIPYPRTSSSCLSAKPGVLSTVGRCLQRAFAVSLLRSQMADSTSTLIANRLQGECLECCICLCEPVQQNWERLARCRRQAKSSDARQQINCLCWQNR